MEKLNQFLAIWRTYFVQPKSWSEDEIEADRSPLSRFVVWLNQDWVELEVLDRILETFRCQANSSRSYPTLFDVRDAYAREKGGTGYTKEAEGCQVCDQSGLIYAPVAIDRSGRGRIVEMDRVAYERSLGNSVTLVPYPCMCPKGRRIRRTKAFADVADGIIDKAMSARCRAAEFNSIGI